MRKIGDLKISTKLLAGFLIVSLLTLATGIIGIVNMKDFDAKYNALYNDYGKAQGELGQLGIAFENTRSSMKTIFIEQNDLATRQAEADKLKGFDQTISEKLDEFSKTINTTDGQSTYNELKSNIEKYKAVRDQAVALALQNDFAGANKLAKEQLSPVVQKIEQDFTDTFTRKISNGNSLSDSYTVQSTNWILAMIVIVVISTAASIALGLGISRHITKPLHKLEKYAMDVASGERVSELALNRKDEVGMVTNSVVQIQRTLEDIISEATLVSSAAAKGDLTVRADTSKFQGGYKDMIQGINDTVDAFEKPVTILVEQLQIMADGIRPDEITGQYEGIYAKLINCQNSMRFSLMELMRVARDLSSHSLEGDLSFRGDTSKLKNSYAGIIDQFNQTLDNIVVPLGKAKEVLKQMSVDNNDLLVEGEYKGDIKELTDAVNATADIINKAVNETAEAITAISEGRLDIQHMRTFRGSWNPISTAVNYTLDSLNDIMRNIHAASEQVASGARQVSDGSQALSSGATEQASSIEEFSASITEISSQTENNAQNASEAKNISVQSSQDAQAGNESMRELLTSMDDIAQASANISKIIKVIDDISFQTNMLALNAAVEAARAGQYGKGFAVVAEEVRNLATKSKNAVNETTELIESSIHKTKAGVKAAQDTAKYFDKIVDGVYKSSSLMEEIAVASHEQASGIAQINTGVQQISQVVQTNAATAEESAASSEELFSQAEFLQHMVKKFKLRDDEASGASADAARIGSNTQPKPTNIPENITSPLPNDISKY